MLPAVSLLKDLKHANIVTLHDIIHTEKSLTLVFEYLDKDLKQYLDDCVNVVTNMHMKLFLFQLLRGLAYCHRQKVLHGDLLINEWSSNWQTLAWPMPSQSQLKPTPMR